MSKQSQNLALEVSVRDIYGMINRWAPDGVLSVQARTFFESFGIEFEDPHLAAVNSICQKTCLRPAGKERWEIPQDKGMDEGAWQLANRLGLVNPVLTVPREEYDQAVIFGATRKGMVPRFLTLFASGVRFKRIIVAAGARPINDEEKEVCRQAGLDPKDKTEADMARLILDQLMAAGVRPEPPPIKYLVAAMKEGGKRPTTGDTLCELINRLDGVKSVVFVSHQPGGMRQRLVVDRILRESGRPEHHQIQTDFLFGAMTEQTRLTPRLVLDEAARLIYELSLLPESYFIGASAARAPRLV